MSSLFELKHIRKKRKETMREEECSTQYIELNVAARVAVLRRC